MTAPVTGMRLRNVKTGEEWVHETDGVFIFIGFDPNTEFIKEAVERDEIGYLIAGSHMETDVPGLFIAGDVRTQLTKQITTAVGDATTAAVAATHYLETCTLPWRVRRRRQRKFLPNAAACGPQEN